MRIIEYKERCQMKNLRLFLTFTACIFFTTSICIKAQDGILGASFPVTDDGTVDNMEAVYNGKNIALIYSWAPGSSAGTYASLDFRRKPGDLYFQSFDSECRPISKPKQILARGTHQVKAIWDGEQYFVAITAYHRSNNFYHHKSLILMILDEKGNVLKQKEIELAKKANCDLPFLQMITGQGDKFCLTYLNGLMNIGYDVHRYSEGSISTFMTVNASGPEIKTRKEIIEPDKSFRHYKQTLTENGIAILSYETLGNPHNYKLSTLLLDGSYVNEIELDDSEIRSKVGLEDFIYTNKGFYFSTQEYPYTKAYFLQVGNSTPSNAEFREVDGTHGRSSKYDIFVDGNFIYFYYIRAYNFISYSGNTREFVVRRHGLKGNVIDEFKLGEKVISTPYFTYPDDFPPPFGTEDYRNLCMVSTGLHSFVFFVRERPFDVNGEAHLNYEYRARKIGNEPNTKSRVVYVKAGTQDVLPKTRLVMWNVANVKNVRITMPDGTNRIYAPTGHMQVQHNGEEQKLILRAKGTNGEKIKRIIKVVP